MTKERSASEALTAFLDTIRYVEMHQNSIIVSLFQLWLSAFMLRHLNLKMNTRIWNIKNVFFYSCEAVSWAELYCGALGFLQFKDFELYWGAVFFKICSHIFMIFEVRLEKWFWSRRNKKWSEKASGFAAWIVFALNLKYSEKIVFERKFAFSLVVFCSHAAIWLLVFTFFFDFLDRIFFLNGFPNPFIVRSWSSFLFSQWKWNAMFFCFVVWRSFFLLYLFTQQS